MSTTNNQRRIEYLSLTDLLSRLHPENPKDHNIPLIAQSFKDHGFGSSGMLDERTGLFLCGHGRIEALSWMKAEGWQLPRYIEDRNGEWYAPVERGYSSENDVQALSYIAVDNQTTIAGGWNEDRLADLLQQVNKEKETIVSSGFDDKYYDELLTKLGIKEVVPDPGPQIDKAAELNKKWQVKRGDVWQISNHRIMCGDSTSAEDVALLMDGVKADAVVTDPPYGINFDPMKKRGGPFGGKSAGGKYIPHVPRPAVIGDDDINTVKNAFELWINLCDVHVWWGANHYSEILPSSSCWLIWDKVNGDNDFADVEIAWCNLPKAARLFRHMWNGMLKDSERGERRLHATQKPIALFLWVYETVNCGHIIVDPFVGGGASILACEQTGRVGYGMEIDPGYCSVTLERLSGLGLKPVRGEGLGLSPERLA